MTDIGPRKIAKKMMPSAAVVFATPVITWWLVGDLSEDSEGSLDYFLPAPELSDSATSRMGLVALGAACFGIVLGARFLRDSLLTIREVAATVPLVALGGYVGFTLRVFTAGGSGANIGAGLMIFFGIVFVPAMLSLAYAILRGWQPPSPTGPEDRRR